MGRVKPVKHTLLDMKVTTLRSSHLPAQDQAGQHSSMGWETVQKLLPLLSSCGKEEPLGEAGSGFPRPGLQPGPRCWPPTRSIHSTDWSQWVTRFGIVFLKETKHCTEVTEYLAGLGDACRAHGPDAAVGNAAVFLLLLACDDIFRIPEVIFHIRNEIESDLL